MNIKKQNRPNRQSRSAFTLIEMVLVLGIISVLAGLGIYSLVNVVQDAEVGRAEADLHTLETNLIRYKTKARFLPSQEQGLQALVERPTKAPLPRSWSQLLRLEAITDPWGNPYQYNKPAQRGGSAYDLYSFGPDGIENTEDDIGNW